MIEEFIESQLFAPLIEFFVIDLIQEASRKGWVPVFRELSKRSNTEDELISSLLAEIGLRLKTTAIWSAQERQTPINKKRKRPSAFNRNGDIVDVFNILNSAAGDKGDKLLAALQFASEAVCELGKSGLALVIDEFQWLDDRRDQFCLTLVLDTLSKLQSSTETQLHAIFSGLPTMLAKMVEAKPHAERLFSNIINLGPLTLTEAREAITKPIQRSESPNRFAEDLNSFIVELSEGYPFLIQYLAYKAWNDFQHEPIKKSDFENILPEVIAKLDEHFYALRFGVVSGKERAVTLVTETLSNPFTPSDLLDIIQDRGGNVTMGAVQQYLLKLQNKNIIYKVKRGAYDYAMPLFKSYLSRCLLSEDPTPVLRALGQE